MSMAARAPRSLLRTPVHELEIVRRARAEWRDRLTPAGRAVVVTSFVLGVLAVDTRRNQTFLLFAVAVGLLVAAFVVARLGRARATLHLSLPVRATAGSDVVVKGRLRTEARASGLLRAAFPERFSPARFSIEPEEVVVAASDPGAADVEVTFTIRARRRGRYEVSSPILRALDPLGLVASVASPRASARQVVLVGPPLFRFDERAGSVGRRLQPGGLPLASSTSDAVELVGTREWRAGDRVRDVHWRSFARRGVPIVKEYHEEFFPRIAIVVDTFLADPNAEADREAFEAALSVAASIADGVGHGEQVVDLVAAGDELHRVQVGRGLGGIDDVLDVLACVEPSRAPRASREGAFADVAPALDEELARTGTAWVILLDWDEARAAFVDRVRELGAEVRAIVVREGATTAPLPTGDLERMPPSAVRRAIEGAS